MLIDHANVVLRARCRCILVLKLSNVARAVLRLSAATPARHAGLRPRPPQASNSSMQSDSAKVVRSTSYHFIYAS